MQGATVDRAHVFADGGGRELVYVAMNRARDTSQVYVAADDLDQAVEDLMVEWSAATQPRPPDRNHAPPRQAARRARGGSGRSTAGRRSAPARWICNSGSSWWRSVRLPVAASASADDRRLKPLGQFRATLAP